MGGGWFFGCFGSLGIVPCVCPRVCATVIQEHVMNKCKVEIEAVTKPPGHHFFGYHDEQLGSGRCCA